MSDNGDRARGRVWCVVFRETREYGLPIDTRRFLKACLRQHGLKELEVTDGSSPKAAARIVELLGVTDDMREAA